MKKLFRPAVVLVFVMGLLAPQAAYANMAAPSQSDIGSTITFQKNNEISVRSEILDITVTGAQADIVATYQMKNTTKEHVSTQSMFLSPNIQNGGVTVLVNGRPAAYAADRYSLDYTTQIVTDDWQYAVLAEENIAGRSEDKNVDAITFQLDFAPDEAYDVVVSYPYRLGGYPDSDFDAKRGEIEYYLAPAAMWKDFSSLTINLFLDRDMPILKSSNLDFEKMDARTYQYTSDTLPEENLELAVDENWAQNIVSTLRSPYLRMGLTILSPAIFLVLAVIFVVIWRVRKKKKAA